MSKARPPSGLSPVALEVVGRRIRSALELLPPEFGAVVALIEAEQEAEVAAEVKAALARAEEERARAASEGAKKAGRAPRPGARKFDHSEIAREYLRLVDAGHSEREARGLLVKRGLASQSTIYRVTRKEK